MLFKIYKDGEQRESGEAVATSSLLTISHLWVHHVVDRDAKLASCAYVRFDQQNNIIEFTNAQSW
jgi:hypothetical protein